MRWGPARSRSPSPQAYEGNRSFAPPPPRADPREAEQSRWGRKGGWKGEHLLIKKPSKVTEVRQPADPSPLFPWRGAVPPAEGSSRDPRRWSVPPWGGGGPGARAAPTLR